MAASFVIFSQSTDLKSINFFAKAVGDLLVTEMGNGYIQMRFPNRKPKVVDDIPLALLNGLSIKPVEVLLNDQAYFVVYAQDTDVHGVIMNY